MYNMFSSSGLLIRWKYIAGMDIIVEYSTVLMTDDTIKLYLYIQSCYSVFVQDACNGV